MNTKRYIAQGDLVIDTLLQRRALCSDAWGASDVASELNLGGKAKLKWELPAGVDRYCVSKNTNGQEIVVDRLTCEFHLPEQGADTPFDEADRIVEDLKDKSLPRDGIDWKHLNASVLAKPAPDPEPQKPVPFFYVYREHGGAPTVQHVTLESARKEAERIASTCDNRVFVLKAISVSKRQTKIDTQEMA